jgi:hypothetical protein
MTQFETRCAELPSGSVTSTVTVADRTGCSGPRALRSCQCLEHIRWSAGGLGQAG